MYFFYGICRSRNVGSITAAGVIEELLIPSAISIFIPTLILQYKLHGALVEPDASTEETAASVLSGWQHKAVFVLGVGGLIFVPIFRYLTDLPPFVGILLVLAVLWTVVDNVPLVAACMGMYPVADVATAAASADPASHRVSWRTGCSGTC